MSMMFRAQDKMQVVDVLRARGTHLWVGGWRGVGAGNKLHGEGDFLARLTKASLLYFERYF